MCKFISCNSHCFFRNEKRISGIRLCIVLFDLIGKHVKQRFSLYHGACDNNKPKPGVFSKPSPKVNVYTTK